LFIINLYGKDKFQPIKSLLIHIKRFNKLFDPNFLLQVMYAKNELLTKAWVQIQIIVQILEFKLLHKIKSKSPIK
jgi:hypothetical protein